MLETVSRSVVLIAGIYALVGVLFALPFALRGVGTLDPSAVESSRGFRVMILPGVVALWPVLAWKWRIAARNRG